MYDNRGVAERKQIKSKKNQNPRQILLIWPLNQFAWFCFLNGTSLYINLIKGSWGQF